MKGLTLRGGAAARRKSLPLNNLMRFSETRCEQDNAVRSHDFALVGAVNAAALAERPEVINRKLATAKIRRTRIGHNAIYFGLNRRGKSHLLSFVVVFHNCIIP